MKEVTRMYLRCVVIDNFGYSNNIYIYVYITISNYTYIYICKTISNIATIYMYI